MCDSDADLASHVTDEHPCNSLWKCYFCNHDSPQKDYIWKHVRTQHHNKHLHICQFKNCKQGTNGRKYGNDEITSVWAHMMKCHGLHNPLGVPYVRKHSVVKQSKESILLAVKNKPREVRTSLAINVTKSM